MIGIKFALRDLRKEWLRLLAVSAVLGVTMSFLLLLSDDVKTKYVTERSFGRMAGDRVRYATCEAPDPYTMDSHLDIEDVYTYLSETADIGMLIDAGNFCDFTIRGHNVIFLIGIYGDYLSNDDASYDDGCPFRIYADEELVRALGDRVTVANEKYALYGIKDPYVYSVNNTVSHQRFRDSILVVSDDIHALAERFHQVFSDPVALEFALDSLIFYEKTSQTHMQIEDCIMKITGTYCRTRSMSKGLNADSYSALADSAVSMLFWFTSLLALLIVMVAMVFSGVASRNDSYRICHIFGADGKIQATRVICYSAAYFFLPMIPVAVITFAAQRKYFLIMQGIVSALWVGSCMVLITGLENRMGSEK